MRPIWPSGENTTEMRTSRRRPHGSSSLTDQCGLVQTPADRSVPSCRGMVSPDRAALTREFLDRESAIAEARCRERKSPRTPRARTASLLRLRTLDVGTSRRAAVLIEQSAWKIMFGAGPVTTRVGYVTSRAILLVRNPKSPGPPKGAGRRKQKSPPRGPRTSEDPPLRHTAVAG